MELDQFMKLFLIEFFTEVITLFFPELARRLDFDRKRDLNKDLYVDPPQGAERFADVLLEVPVTHPPPESVISHFESQQQNRFDFPARMLGYICLIYAREIEAERRDAFTLAEFTAWQNRKQIFPVVFCHYPLEAEITVQSYEMGVANGRLRCEYTAISFPRLPAQEYLDQENLAVCALAVFMDAEGFTPAELKVACYRKLMPYLSTLTVYRRDLIIHAVETFISLTDEEEQKYNDLIREVYPEVNQMIVNPLIERGRQQGVQEGRQQTLQKSILTVLSHRFPPTPPVELREQILSVTDISRLERLLEATLEVDSLDALTQNGFFE
jgi:hypothetical protein